MNLGKEVKLKAKKILKKTAGPAIAPVKRAIRDKLPFFYFMSFPKSGRTWVEVFLAKYYSLKCGGPVALDFGDMLKANKCKPRILFQHGKQRAQDSSEVKNFAKRHFGKPVILMVRDPRDVVVSYYFQLSKRRKDIADGRDKSISEFVRDKTLGVERIIYYMNMWYGLRDGFGWFLLVRYEDFKTSPEKEFKKLLEFLGEKNIDERIFKESIGYASFGNMKKMEKKNALGDDKLKPADHGDPESFKVRKGKIGGHRDYLGEEDVNYLNAEMKKLNSDFGYKI